MALPAPGNSISANQINVEATRSGTANAPLSGTSSTPQAGSLVKIYEGAGVNQSAPHAYSEFYSKSYAQVVGPINAGPRSASYNFAICFQGGITQYWYQGTAGTLPSVGAICYDTSNVPGTVLQAGHYRRTQNISDGRMQIGNIGQILTINNC